MRYQGEIVEWNEQKRYGFILPRGSKAGDPVVFLLGSTFINRKRAPKVGDIVTYEVSRITQEPGSRKLRSELKAERTSYLGEAVESFSPPSKSPALQILSVLFISALAVSALIHPFGKFALGWSFALSLASLLLYAVDKGQALRKSDRIPEKTLLATSVLGRWPGAVLGQQLLRHKTSKASFQLAFKACVFANLALMAVAFYLALSIA